MTLVEAVAAMLGLSTEDTVGLVMRWDGDDTKLWTLFSSPRADNLPANLSPVAISNFTKQVWDAAQNAYVPMANTAKAGLHAEEIVLACWAGFVAAAGGAPTRVELYLSKSPCHGDSGSTPMAVGLTNHAVFGCSLKLAGFIAAMPTVRWTIRYYDLAGAKDGSSDQQRHDAGQAYWRHIKTRAALDATLVDRANNWQNYVPAKQVNAPAHIRQNAVNQGSQRLSDTFDAKVAELHVPMRSVSVMQAQSGIVKLEALRNCDIARILRQPVAL